MLPLTALLVSAAIGAGDTPIETLWGGPAELTYRTGFTDNVRRHPQGGVCLFDMELIQNDAAGAGWSEKGASGDVIWGTRRARKVLELDDPRTLGAFVVLFTHSDAPPHPLTFEVNGHRGKITKDNHETYRWIEFPADALKAGANTIELYCPEAQSAEEGWDLYIARADEFEAGGGDPGPVGETSFRSDDGGATWKQSPFGAEGKTPAEYSVRLSLDRYRSRGTLDTPAVDLCNGGAETFITPMRGIIDVSFEVDAESPE